MTSAYLKKLLGEREKIILVTRQHGLVLLSEILIELVLFIAIIGLVTAGTLFVSPLAWLALVLLILPIVSMLRDVLIWSNRQYIVSNRRVIQISGVFDKHVIDSSLEKVNDVKMHQSFLGRMFNYGDIEIMTASELGVNLFRRIGNPIRFKTAMLNAKEALEVSEYPGRVMANGEQKVEDIPTMIAKLDELRQKGIITPEEFAAKKQELLKKM
jgi:uncharacterized membrane protein YdbT with pleckstrin-like domain